MVDDCKSTNNDEDSENTVSVYNLPSIYDESDVQSLFANVGTVVECTLKQEDEKSSNIAIVKFSSQKEAEDAAVLSGVSVRYHILRIMKGLPQVIAKNEKKEDEHHHDKSYDGMNSTSKVGERGDRKPSKRSEVGESTTSKPSDPPDSQIDKDKPLPDRGRNDVKRARGEKMGYSSDSSGGSTRRMTRNRRSRSISRERNRRNRPGRSYRQSRSYSRDRYRRRESKYDRDRDRRRYSRRRYSRSSSRSRHYSVSDDYSRGRYSTDSRDSDRDYYRRNRRGRYRDRSRSRSSSSRYGSRNRRRR